MTKKRKFRFQLFSKVTLKNITYFVLMVLLIIVASYLLLIIKYANKIGPNVYIAQTNVSGLTKGEAMEKIINESDFSNEIILNHESDSFTIDLSEINFNYDFEKTVNKVALTKSPIRFC